MTPVFPITIFYVIRLGSSNKMIWVYTFWVVASVHNNTVVWYFALVRYV